MAFRSVLVDGLFYIQDGILLVKRDADPDPIIVDNALEPIKDLRVQFTAHHWPPTPVDQKRWGGGCCMWEKSGKCPAGHHENPAYLLHFASSGVLKKIDESWWLEEGGVLESIPLEKLDGHLGRIVAVTLIDAESFGKDLDFSGIDLNKTADPETQAIQLETIERQTKQLHGMMTEFQELLKSLKKGG